MAVDNLIDLSVKSFIDEVDSSSPAPGGGSVSSLAGAIGCALSRMVCHLSFGKKKFEALDETIKTEFTVCFDNLAKFQTRLVELIDEDTKSFGVFMKALKLPKDTEEEKQIRLKEMEEATKVIIKVPYEIAKLSCDALESLETIVKNGNKNAITDVGVAAILLDSAVEGACLNVKINLPGLSDTELVNTYKNDVEMLIDKSHSIRTSYLQTVHSNL